MMVKGACHCGAVTIELRHAPQSLTECNCSICRRYGAHRAYCNRKIRSERYFLFLPEEPAEESSFFV